MPKGRKLLVGVSGGRDSIALLHALHECGWKKLVVCHLDHRLRGSESRRDAALVRRTARKLGVAFESARARTKAYAKDRGASVELAARELRHAFFEECAKRHRCRRLVLAHHADDQVETCLFNFLRGSGAAGLAGMRTSSQLGRLEVLRPLLGVTREDIGSWLRSRKLSFADDSSNASLEHSRNRIRHGILPAIRASFGESFRAAILRAAEILRMEDDLLAEQTPVPGKTLRVAHLRALPPALRHRAVLVWLRANAVPDAGFLETRRVLSLLADGPAKINLPGKLHARRRSGIIFLEKERGS